MQCIFTSFIVFFRMFENFFFSHITLLEGHLEKLKLSVEKAHYNRGKFIDIVTEVRNTQLKNAIGNQRHKS
jgi:hypothetical protein